MDIKILILIGVIVVAIIGAYIYLYNKLTAARQQVHESWAGVDVQLKRRHDLIGNLIDVAKNYASYEKALLEKITQERAEAINTNQGDLQKRSQVETNLETDVRTFFANAEAYPNLKANTVYLQVQKDLKDTEDKIASSRSIYNAHVAQYNTMVALFPHIIVAKLNNFKEATYFQNDKK